MENPCKRCNNRSVSEDFCNACKTIMIAENIISDDKYYKKFPMRKTKDGPRKWTSCRATPCVVCHEIKQSVYHLEKGVICSPCYKKKNAGNSVVC